MCVLACVCVCGAYFMIPSLTFAVFKIFFFSFLFCLCRDWLHGMLHNLQIWRTSVTSKEASKLRICCTISWAIVSTETIRHYYCIAGVHDDITDNTILYSCVHDDITDNTILYICALFSAHT